MKKSIRILCVSLCVFMLCLTAIGYAALSDTLSVISGIDLMAPPFQGVYIHSVEIVSTNGIVSNDLAYSKPTNLKNELSVQQANASITYRITVHNNTDITYWYLGTALFDEYGSNDLIESNGGIFITTSDHPENGSDAFDISDWIPPQTMRVFYATYRFGANATGNISTLINFKFGLHMASVQDEFLKILNDKNSEYGYHYLADAFNKAYTKDGSTTIGNIGKDAEIFNNLFGPNLTVNVDGTEKPATIMVSRRNVDSNASSGDAYSTGSLTGCEYTVYITVDNLSGSTATVYAVSYTCDQNGVWRQIGELYEGTCPTNSYDGENNGFDVHDWEATAKEYRVTDDIYYKVGYEQGETYDKILTIEELMSANDVSFYNKVNNNSQKLLMPVCKIIYSYTHMNGQWVESDNTANMYNPGYDLLRAAFDRIKPYCYIGNGAQEVKIQNANSLTRAELIQLLEAVQHAYDYYLSVN